MPTQVTVIGNLGSDPEIRHTTSGKAVCNVNVADNDGTRDNPHTNWIAITAWEKTAEILAELRKGRRVTIIGRLRMDEWEQSGEKRTRLGVVAQMVFGHGDTRAEAPQADMGQDGRPQGQEAAEGTEGDAGNDSLPF